MEDKYFIGEKVVRFFFGEKFIFEYVGSGEFKQISGGLVPYDIRKELLGG